MTRIPLLPKEEKRDRKRVKRRARKKNNDTPKDCGDQTKLKHLWFGPKESPEGAASERFGTQ